MGLTIIIVLRVEPLFHGVFNHYCIWDFNVNCIIGLTIIVFGTLTFIVL
jgi:hypothetical protein